MTSGWRLTCLPVRVECVCNSRRRRRNSVVLILLQMPALSTGRFFHVRSRAQVFMPRRRLGEAKRRQVSMPRLPPDLCCSSPGHAVPCPKSSLPPCPTAGPLRSLAFVEGEGVNLIPSHGWRAEQRGHVGGYVHLAQNHKQAICCAPSLVKHTFPRKHLQNAVATKTWSSIHRLFPLQFVVLSSSLSHTPLRIWCNCHVQTREDLYSNNSDLVCRCPA